MIVTAENTVNGKSLARGDLTFIDNAVAATTGTILLKATFRQRGQRVWPGEVRQRRLDALDGAKRDRRSAGAVQNGQGSYVYVVRHNTVAVPPP